MATNMRDRSEQLYKKYSTAPKRHCARVRFPAGRLLGCIFIRVVTNNRFRYGVVIDYVLVSSSTPTH